MYPSVTVLQLLGQPVWRVNGDIDEPGTESVCQLSDAIIARAPGQEPDTVASFVQAPKNLAPDETSSAGDEYVHDRVKPRQVCLRSRKFASVA